MSESNKESRSLRPRAKLKRPEYYSSSSDQSEKGSSLKKKTKKETESDDLEVSVSKKRRKVNSKSLGSLKKNKSATVGGCTSLQFHCRSSQASRSFDLSSSINRNMSDQNDSNRSTNDQSQNRRTEDDFRLLDEMFEQRGLPSNFFTSLAPRMQQLLQHTMVPMPNARSNQIIEQLSHQGLGALHGLTDLCEMLCMGNEDNLAGLNYKQAVPLLIKLLQDTETEVSQYAARALTYLLESLPRSSHVVAEAIPVLLLRVSNIHDDALIVVAEQSLSCLEKLSYKHARQILNQRGADQVTTFIDFFSIAAQRHALSIVAFCYKAVSDVNDFELIKNTIPIMISRLKSSDKKSTEFAIQACSVITEKICSEEASDFVHNLFKSDLVVAICDIISDQQNVSGHYLIMCLKLLRQLALSCNEMVYSMVKTSLPSALSAILKSDLQSTPQREPQELTEAVKLVGALLPRLKNSKKPTEENTLDESESENDDIEGLEKSFNPISIMQVDFEHSNPLIEQMYLLCWKLLGAFPNTSLRIAIIKTIMRMSYCSRPTELDVLVNDKDCYASSQIQQLLDSQDTKVIVQTLKLTRTILKILPQFNQKFRREGLHHCLVRISTTKSKYLDQSTSSTTIDESDETAFPGTSKTVKKSTSSAGGGETSSSTETTKKLTKKVIADQDFAQASSRSSLTSKASERSRSRYDSISQKEILTSWIKTETDKILSDFFAEENEEKDSSLINKMKKCRDGLASTDKSSRSDSLKTLFSIVMNNDLSPFELLYTGVLENLLKYITSNHELEFLQEILGMPSPTSAPDIIIPSSNEVYIKLIHKINQIISQVERYPVKLTDGSRLRLHQLNQNQVKCNLQRDPNCTKTKNWLSGPVKIEPLAHVSAIERYLILKGFGQTSDEGISSRSINLLDTDDESMDGTSAFSGFTKEVRQLELSIKGKPLPPNITVYQAIREYDMDDNSDMESDSEDYDDYVWRRTFTINYRVISKEVPQQKHKSKNSTNLQDIKSLSNDDPLWMLGMIKKNASPLSKYVKYINLYANNKESENLSTMVSLLSCLFGLSRYWQTLYPGHLTCSSKPICPTEEFENVSITSKCWRQLQDPLCVLSGNVPVWLTELSSVCPFVLPFDLRRFLFYISTFDRQRAIQKLLERIPEHENLNQSGSGRQIQARVLKEKVVVNRQKLLKSAETVFESYLSSNASIEIQYLNEVGTGLGPTLEFYTLISHELRRSHLGLWRSYKTSDENLKGGISATASNLPWEGLYPGPLAKNCKKSTLNNILNKYKLLGRCLARSLKDSRLLDLPISSLLARALLQENNYFQFTDLNSIDNQLYRSLQHLQKLVHTDKSSSVEDLYLDFILPGHQNIELVKAGRNKSVNGDNLEKYIDLVVHWSLAEGVRRQLEALRCGFNEVFDIHKLQIFLPSEIPRLFCGSETKTWTVAELESSIRPDHGYTKSCRAVQFLITVLSNLNNAEQADFLRFVTGSPHLPVGGLKSLNPPLTVVKKTVEGENAENYLPSVMTCVNYLKLPDYINLEVMREKLLQAISDGQGVFLLS